MAPWRAPLLSAVDAFIVEEELLRRGLLFGNAEGRKILGYLGPHEYVKLLCTGVMMRQLLLVERNSVPLHWTYVRDIFERTFRAMAQKLDHPLDLQNKIKIGDTLAPIMGGH